MSGSERIVTLDGPSKGRRGLRRLLPLVRRTAGQQMTDGFSGSASAAAVAASPRTAPAGACRAMFLSSAALAAPASSRSPDPAPARGRRGDGFARYLELAGRASSGEEVRGPPHDLVFPGRHHQGPRFGPELARRASTYAGVAIAGSGGVSSSAPRRRTAARQGKAR